MANGGQEESLTAIRPVHSPFIPLTCPSPTQAPYPNGVIIRVQEKSSQSDLKRSEGILTSLTGGPTFIPKVEKFLKEPMNGSLKISNYSFYAILCPVLCWKISHLELLLLTVATEGGSSLCIWWSEYFFLDCELSLCKCEKYFAQILSLIFLRYRQLGFWEVFSGLKMRK